MKHTSLITLTLALAAFGVRGEDKPLLAIPGKAIYENKLSDGAGAPWKAAKGKWEAADGVLRGSELEADKHGAVVRLPNKLKDFVIEYEFKFAGAKVTSLSINGIKDHMARIMIAPKSVAIQRDDSDHEGPDKAVVFARFPTDLGEGWHKVRLEMVGDKMLGKVDDLVAWGANDLFLNEKASPGFTVSGQSVDFRNFSLKEATLNPAWEEVKGTLPKPGEKVAAAARPAAAKGAAKGTGKAKKKAE
jgi:hypothetical protein